MREVPRMTQAFPAVGPGESSRCGGESLLRQQHPEREHGVGGSRVGKEPWDGGCKGRN